MFTLLVLYMLLVLGMGIISVSLNSLRSSMATSDSAAGFQAADGAVEAAILAMKEEHDNFSTTSQFRTLNGIASRINGYGYTSSVSCSGGRISGQIAGTPFQIEFFDGNDARFTVCNTNVLLRIKTIKSSGDPRGTRRVIAMDPHFDPCGTINEISQRSSAQLKPFDAEVFCNSKSLTEAPTREKDTNSGLIKTMCPWKIATRQEAGLFTGGASGLGNIWVKDQGAADPENCWKKFRYPGGTIAPPDVCRAFESTETEYVRCVR